MKNLVLFIGSFVILWITATPISAQDTLLINYQGRLTDDGGNPITGTPAMTFAIYDAGGVSKWSESHPTVQVNDGLFNVMLGTHTALPDSVFTGDDRYLGITVGGDPEISPRTLLTSAPSAALAKKIIGDIETAEGMLVMKDDNGDSVIVLSAGIGGGMAQIYLTEPIDPQSMVAISASHDAGSQLTIYDREPIDKSEIIAISGSPSGLGTIKMFNPQPEPPRVYVDLSVDPASGPSLGFFDDVGQVMGLDPSPFNSGFSIKLMDPGDDGKLFELTGNHLTNEVSMKLMDPGDDGKIFELSSAVSSGASLKMFNPQPEPPRVYVDLSVDPASGPSLGFFDDIGQVMGFDPSPFNEAFSMYLMDPGDDGRVLELVGNHVTDEAGFYLMDPGDDGRLAEISSTYGTGSGAGEVAVYDTHLGLESHLTPARLVLEHTPGMIAYPPISLDATGIDDPKIGIGTDAPSEPLVIGADLGYYSGNMIAIGNAASGSFAGITMGMDANNRAYMAWDNTDGYLYMGTRSAGTFYSNSLVLNDGQVGIGISSPSEELHVVGDICYTGSIGTCSDRRYKKNVTSITGALDKVSRLRGVKFDWKQDEFPENKFSDQEQVGLIAQDVMEVFPQVVSQDDNGYYNIDYTKFAPLLINAVKELKAENEELRDRIEALENR